MYFDRRALKLKAKGLVRSGVPAVYLVTLVFLLATDWVSTAADLVFSNPVSAAMEAFYSWYEALRLQDGTVSQGTTQIITRQVLSNFQGTRAMIALLVVLLVAFYSMVVSLGYDGYCLRIMRGQQSGYGELFSKFYIAGKIILLNILIDIFICLWTCLFILPGFVAFYRYRMAVYILLDDPEISALEAIRRSKAMMRGHKAELFVLDLSFLGWNLVYYVVTNVVYSVVYYATYQPVMADLISLLVGTLVSMFLGAYISLTTAGYYLHLVQATAPPVDPWPNQNGRYGPGPEDDPWNNQNQGWNR